MQVSVAFRQMDTSEPLQSYATRKLENVLAKYLIGQDVQSQVVFSVERFWHIANFTITINGWTVKAVERSENMYSSVDLALDKLDRQLRRVKDRFRSHKPNGRERRFTMGVLAPSAPTEPPVEAAEEQDAAAPTPVTVVKHETYVAPYMTAEEAVLQLGLRGAEFFVFTNSESERINIIHRRHDGGYGLIDAEPPQDS